MIVWASKDPDEVSQQLVDWRLHPRWRSGDGISSASFSLATAAGLTLSDTDTDNGYLSWVTLNAGTAGQRGKVLCQVITEEGQTLQQTATVLIEAR